MAAFVYLLEETKSNYCVFYYYHNFLFCSIYCHNVFVTLTDRFAGPMDRFQAEAELLNRGNSTYLVRHRSRESTEYAISIKSVHCSCNTFILLVIVPPLGPIQIFTKMCRYVFGSPAVGIYWFISFK